jgi:hypothetical protein
MEYAKFDFIYDDINRFRLFQKLFYRLKESQSTRIPGYNSSEWLEYYDQKALEFFFREGEDVWDFESLIDALQTAEYQLVRCDATKDNQAELVFEVAFYGLEQLYVLIEYYGFKIRSAPFGMKLLSVM